MSKPLISKRWPVGHILNPRTPYFNASQTDVSRTMAAARAELERQKHEREQNVSRFMGRK